MFAAIGRYLRAIGYLLTGRIDSARKALSQDPHVIQATFDRVIEEKTNRIQQYKDAVAGMIAQQEKKISTVRKLTEDVNRLEQLKEGAAAKARSVVEELKGKGSSMEEIKKDEDYMRCLSAFNDFTSTLAEKTDHITELEGDIEQIGTNIGSHKVQLQGLVRDIDKLKEEASATVADVITAREEEKISDALSGVSADRFSKDLQDLRELREKTKAKARISREMAGTDTRSQEAEFLDFARKGVANDEFDELIGLATEKDTEASSGDADLDTKLPE